MNAATAKDILDADVGRLNSGLAPLLTDAGRRVMENIIIISTPLPQIDIDNIIRKSLKTPL